MRVVYQVVLFHSTSQALRAEKVLKGAGLEIKLVPVPRHLSSDCGICLRSLLQDREVLVQALDEAEVEVAGIHDF